MKIVLILSLCYTVSIYGQKNVAKKLPATDERYLFDLQQEYLTELKCLKRIDAILKSKWTMDLNKIRTEDLGTVKPGRSSHIGPSKEMYNNDEQEWLMESSSSGKEIESCVRGLIPEIVPLMNRAEINCVNSIFAKHIEEEIVHEDVFKRSLKSKARKQLPFRKFYNFGEVVETLFQSRTPDALNGVEQNAHVHAESYLATEQDRIDPTWIIEQDCAWENAMALRKAPNVNARLNEFVRQVKDSVNQLLAGRLVRQWYNNATLPRDKYRAWLRARDDMTLKINKEVEMLRNQNKDPQWLCEHASELAYQLSEEQGMILVDEEESTIYLASNDAAAKARGIEKAMEKTKDFRQPIIKILAEKFETGTQCFTAFLHLVQNHRRFDIALAFVDSGYDYSEIYCKYANDSLGLLRIRFCKCAGSFCVSHAIAYIFSEEYALTQGPDGTYKVVHSGVPTRYKVKDW